ncbi:hypothetical protein [Streptomyces sp. NPDC048385]|uniref:hypothetical protein n=1 Tax=unclassified Streptomyces TaxID=2593676 RepID=UPI00343CB56A
MTANSFFRRYLNALIGERPEPTGYRAARDGYSFGRRYLAALFRVSLNPHPRNNLTGDVTVSDMATNTANEPSGRFDVFVHPAIVMTVATFIVAFEQIVNYKYGATGIVGLCLMAIGIRAKSPAVMSFGAIFIVLLVVW